MVNANHNVTALLVATREGEAGAFDRLVEMLYDRMRDLAHRELLRGRQGDLQTTALVNELYLKLVGERSGWQDRGHFFAACTKAIRRIVVDEARKQVSLKRGGGVSPLELDEGAVGERGDSEWLLCLDQAMEKLAARDPRLVQVFEFRYFGGYTVDETAEALGLSKRTTERDWARARAWLRQALDCETW